MNNNFLLLKYHYLRIWLSLLLPDPFCTFFYLDITIIRAPALYRLLTVKVQNQMSISLYHICVKLPIQLLSPVTFLKNNTCFYSVRLLASRQTTKLVEYSRSAVHYYLSNIFVAKLHIWRPTPPSATQGVGHAVVTGIHRWNPTYRINCIKFALRCYNCVFDVPMSMLYVTLSLYGLGYQDCDTP